MSQRNGRAVARSIAARRRVFRAESMGQYSPEAWQKILKSRPDWKQIGTSHFQYKTGDRIMFAGCHSWKDLIARITVAEVKTLGEGLAPEVRSQLVVEAVMAAMQWWERNGES